MQSEEADSFVTELSQEVSTRLANLSVKGRTITLKLKVRSKDAPVTTAKFMGHGICDNVVKSATLTGATDDARVISRECVQLLGALSVPAADIRGVTVVVVCCTFAVLLCVMCATVFSSLPMQSRLVA